MTISIVTATMKAGSGSISSELEPRSQENESMKAVPSTAPDENVDPNKEERQVPHDNDAVTDEKGEEQEEKRQEQEEIIAMHDENEEETDEDEKGTDENDEVPEEIDEVVTEFAP